MKAMVKSLAVVPCWSKPKMGQFKPVTQGKWVKEKKLTVITER